MRRLFFTLVSLLVATGTAAAATALVTRDLNLRPSPSTRYAPVTVLPAGAIVTVSGCVRSYRWCRVYWRGHDGWASASYLAIREAGYRGYYDDYASSIGVPVIAGVVIGSIIHQRVHRPRWRRHNPRWRHRDRRWRRHIIRGGGHNRRWGRHRPRWNEYYVPDYNRHWDKNSGSGEN